MVETHGLTHLALAVHDPERSAAFYGRVFGAVVVFREPGFVQIQTPGARDVLVFERIPSRAGKQGGVAHFGFRLVRPEDIAAAAREVEAAGGKVTRQGEFSPGEPYLFATDPDGYQLEIWYEPPTPVDPP